MSATLVLECWTGSTGSPTYTTITGNLRMNADDNVFVSGSTNPAVIPTYPDFSYSYWKALRLNCTSPPVTIVNNVLFYCSDEQDAGTGRIIVGQTATDYEQASGSVGVSGDQLSTGSYSTLADTPTDITLWTGASPLAVAGSTDTTARDWCDFIVLQNTYDSSVVPGAGTQVEYHIQWDED